MFAYSALCVAAGGYTTAWVARRAPVRHAAVMGIVQVALTVWAMISLPHQAPLRNWIVALVFTLPAAACGGLLRAKRAGAGSPARE
jgi:peptidoglycan/LPS O-acetylase OafA/YrhL